MAAFAGWLAFSVAVPAALWLFDEWWNSPKRKPWPRYKEDS